MNEDAKCREVGHVWVRPMLLKPETRHNAERVCARCGLYGLGNEPLAKVFIGKIYAEKPDGGSHVPSG